MTASSPQPSKNVQPAELDATDRRLLTALHGDARLSNTALADLVGIAPSTCHGRVRRLQEIGVIRGFWRASSRRSSPGGRS
jgi:DNA-binding Lrp family transcriptional regulator